MAALLKAWNEDPRNVSVSEFDCRMKTSEQEGANASKAGSGRGSLIWAVLTALVLRLIVVWFVYPGFLEPGRDHWEFGYETGKIAYSIANGHGYSNPFWIETGPTAIIS